MARTQAKRCGLQAMLACARAMLSVLFVFTLAIGPVRAETNPEDILSAVVGVTAEVPAEARTAQFLGTERAGSGVVIDSDGLVVTIGYLILEAASASIIGPDGKETPATIVAYDYDTGFGLLRAVTPPAVKPMAIGDSSSLRYHDRVLVAGHGGTAAVQPALVISRRDFAGYWEYLLENAIFTSPPHPGFGGAALIDGSGKLVGIGSLILPDAGEPGTNQPGNMFVPIDRLPPIMADLLEHGRPSTPAKPWLGMFSQEAHGRVFVISVAGDGPAAKAGIAPGDIILAVGSQKISGQADLYRKIWALGSAGVEVPLTVLHDDNVAHISVRSGNRYDWLKLQPTY